MKITNWVIVYDFTVFQKYLYNVDILYGRTINTKTILNFLGKLMWIGSLGSVLIVIKILARIKFTRCIVEKWLKIF